MVAPQTHLGPQRSSGLKSYFAPQFTSLFFTWQDIGSIAANVVNILVLRGPVDRVWRLQGDICIKPPESVFTFKTRHTNRIHGEMAKDLHTAAHHSPMLILANRCKPIVTRAAMLGKGPYFRRQCLWLFWGIESELGSNQKLQTINKSISLMLTRLKQLTLHMLPGAIRSPKAVTALCGSVPWEARDSFTGSDWCCPGNVAHNLRRWDAAPLQQSR